MGVEPPLCQQETENDNLSRARVAVAHLFPGHGRVACGFCTSQCDRPPLFNPGGGSYGHAGVTVILLEMCIPQTFSEKVYQQIPCKECLALRVPMAETRLTVYRFFESYCSNLHA